MKILKNTNSFNYKNFFSKIVKNLEQFGRTLIVPISILPIMAIVGAIGYIMISIGKSPLVNVYNTSATYKGISEGIRIIGLAPIYNLDILFAIGIATGLAKDEKISAALCGIVALIGFYFAGNVLDKYAQITNKLPENLTKSLQSIERFGKNSKFFNLNTLGGILAGYLGYFIRKYTYRLQLPMVIAFFGGPKFSPVATLLIAFIVGLPFAYLWVYIYYFIALIGQTIKKSKAGGAFVYGFFERLLILFGLHHVSNSILRFTPAGEVFNHLNPETGKTEIIEGFFNILLYKVNNGINITIEDSMISNETYATKIFSLPGAALAMLLAVPKEKRKKAVPIIFGAVASSFLSGIIEPIEFTFIFVAPILYIAHSIMTGFSFMIMYLANIGAVAGTGKGIITWFLYNVPAYKIISNFWIIWIVGPIFFAKYFVVFYFLITKLNLKTPERDDYKFKLFSKKDYKNKQNKKIISEENKNLNFENLIKNDLLNKEKHEDVQKSIKLIEFYGGFENMIEIVACISRLRISVKDKNKVDKQAIKTMGASGVVETNIQVQSVFGSKAMVYSRIINNIKKITNE
ncbi:PTS transporter subunit EIIC [[Mycoplasma] collis]|uniref:PTS transporter subunit EIIC n=1 Tax=[Mycoplasma] collis TaxID=2127 RepID=UPI00068F8EDC|nr:PTS transporter subunit EIIC [[Mycoplasma] collis]